MSRHTELIDGFYAAFARRDWRAMAACYHPRVHFSDEVFDLHGADAGAMWHMLAERGTEFRDGLVIRHVDRFDFWRWSRQALGAPGWLLGWTSLLRGKVRAQAAKGLAAFNRASAAG